MLRSLLLSAIFLLLAFTFSPTPVSAQEDSRFVTCSGPDCQACHLVQMAHNIIDFLIIILTVVAALIFAYAGFVLVTSGGDVTAKERAKTMFTNVIIGYLIVLSAWLLIDTGMKALLNEEVEASYGPWNEIECVTQPDLNTEREITFDDSDWYAPGAGGGHFRENPGGNFSEGSGAGDLSSCEVASSGPCSVSALREAGFGDLANDAARIAGAESGCNPNAESRTDTTTDGRTYSVGTWQINLAVHDLNCNGRRLNCPAAFRSTGTRNRFGVRQYEVVNESLYTQCVEMAKVPSCNNAKAAELARNSGDMGDWACSARKCGVSTSRNHLCPL